MEGTDNKEDEWKTNNRSVLRHVRVPFRTDNVIRPSVAAVSRINILNNLLGEFFLNKWLRGADQNRIKYWCFTRAGYESLAEGTPATRPQQPRRLGWPKFVL